MPLTEFSLIKKYFSDIHYSDKIVALGVGDDCAAFDIPSNQQLLVSVDTLVEGVHFPVGADAENLALRALLVNLSDIAAMGAKPCAFTLSLSLPKIEEQWLGAFAQGLKKLAKEYGLSLVGGDTTRGPLSISIQIFGVARREQLLKRSNAQCGDNIVVTGYLGDAAAAIPFLNSDSNTLTTQQQHFLQRYYQPDVRVEFAQAIAPIANSAIDISDGFAADLGHILQASNCGAVVYCQQLPASAPLGESLSATERLAHMLSGGDDYELCFTVAEARWQEIVNIAEGHQVPIACVGVVNATSDCVFLDQAGVKLNPEILGFQHFS